MSAIPIDTQASAVRLAVAPVAPAIGATIAGADLALPLDHATVTGINDALLQRQVIFFRVQTLADHGERRVMQRVTLKGDRRF